MTDEIHSETGGPVPEEEPKQKKTRAKKSAAGAKTKEPEAKSQSAGAQAPKSAAKAPKKEAAAKAAPKKRAAAKKKAAAAGESTGPVEETPQLIEDPIGDVSDGEGRTYTGESLESDAESQAEAYRAGVAVDAVDGTLESREPGAEAADQETAAAEIAEDVAAARESEAEPGAKARPPARLERLQKILSQAGIASRRRAEEMIVAGRVIVNGQVVTELGSKADPEHDHIRVDGKLLHGAERHRYFLLNKPKGYVTTVDDPEGRPTVMDFVSKLGERVYPVGRLDFQSEGLLLLTNDGELANQLTRAASGVEKTYVVKVAGQPTEEDLEKLRGGVSIERGKEGSGRVRTAPARVRQIRPGDNPWFEVVLTEGRNRELRKMFSAVGHFVEKIRRVGYGPLVLDVEPGKLRELTMGEVEVLRLTAEGKMKPRRIRTEAMLPREAGVPAEERRARPYGKGRPDRGPQRDFGKRGEARGEQREFRPRRPERSEQQEFGRRGQAPGERREFRPRRPEGGGQREFQGRGEGRFGATERPQREFRSERPRQQFRGERPQREFRAERPPREPRGERPQREFRTERPLRETRGERPQRSGAGGREWQQRPRGDRPAWGRSEPRQGGESRPGGFGRRREGGEPRSERPAKPFGTRPGGERNIKAPGRGFSKGPGRDWKQGAGEKPVRGESGGPPFRGRTEGGRGGRPRSGPQRPPRGGFGGQGGGKRGGFRPGGKGGGGGKRRG